MQNGFCPRNTSIWTILCLLSMVGMSACGKSKPETHTFTLGQEITTPIGCQNPALLRDQFWSTLYREAATSSVLPESTTLTKSLVATGQPSGIVSAYSNIYSSVLEALHSDDEPKFSPPEVRRQKLLKRLAELELGDRTTPEKSAEQDRLENQFRVLEKLDAKSGIHLASAGACPGPTPTPTAGPSSPPTDGNPDSVELFESYRQSYAPAVYGAYKIMSVGYQSCSILDFAPLTSSTPPVQGIEVTGTHPAGGKTREVASASDVMRTNPYYSVGRITPQGSCLPEQNNPLIYDFGGKPYVSSETSMEMDLFRNGGTGTEALGIDCSGLVSGALLTSGLKLKKTASVKAYQVSGVSSSMLMDPAANGLSCLAKRTTIQPGDTLKAGDIIVQSGHVVMADQVGSDPFGLAAITKSVDCTATKIVSSKFNFSIVQSSASLGGIGMNRYNAASFLAGNSAMRNGLVDYAIAHCKAKFGATAITSPTATAVVVRHLGGSECTDQRVQVKYSSCMKDCARPAARSLASVK